MQSWFAVWVWEIVQTLSVLFRQSSGRGEPAVLWVAQPTARGMTTKVVVSRMSRGVAGSVHAGQPSEFEPEMDRESVAPVAEVETR